MAVKLCKSECNYTEEVLATESRISFNDPSSTITSPWNLMVRKAVSIKTAVYMDKASRFSM